ncbi:hypothetical protein SEA_SCHWARTZ33_1 [Gordonia phage Schwartz33]|nr:hypothetical protein SEA_SCHWARTZ33_1 [Gordonia phage Schwartz33]
MKPTVGRIVHYQSYGTPGGEYLPEARAAIITEVHKRDSRHLPEPGEPFVGLCVLNPTGMFFNRMVPHSADPRPGHWSWPPREE